MGIVVGKLPHCLFHQLLELAVGGAGLNYDEILVDVVAVFEIVGVERHFGFLERAEGYFARIEGAGHLAEFAGNDGETVVAVLSLDGLRIFHETYVHIVVAAAQPPVVFRGTVGKRCLEIGVGMTYGNHVGAAADTLASLGDGAHEVMHEFLRSARVGREFIGGVGHALYNLHRRLALAVDVVRHASLRQLLSVDVECHGMPFEYYLARLAF